MLASLLLTAAVVSDYMGVHWMNLPDMSRDTAKILVTEFAGPDPGIYRVTDAIVDCFERQLGDCDFIVIERYPEPVSEAEAAQAGRDAGAVIVVYGTFTPAERGADFILNYCLAFGEPGVTEPVAQEASFFSTSSGHLLEDLLTEGPAPTEMTWDHSPSLVNFCNLVLGETALLMGSRDEYASTWLQAAAAYSLGIDPETLTETYSKLGFAFFGAGDWESADESFSRCLELSPGRVDILLNRGLLRCNTGSYIGAAADFNQVIALDPDNHEAYYQRGSMRCSTGALEEGIQDLTIAIGLDPTDNRCYVCRANSYANQGHLDLAMADLLKARELAPEDSEAMLTLGWVFFLGESYDDAIAMYDEALSRGSEEYDPYFMRGCCYAAQGRLEEALQDYNAAIELEPEELTGYFYRGQILYRMGRMDEAKNDLEIYVTYGSAPDELARAQQMLDSM
jgi:tetratricopeptide (TPR) repeat protein